jgi:DNA adenine methylase
LAGWDINEGDFGDINIGPMDFIYADPPYDVPFTTYSAGGFSWDDQIRLAQWLAHHPNPVIASNQATERILDLYSSLGFDIAILNAPRMISCTGDRTPAKEMLATRNLTLRNVADGNS